MRSLTDQELRSHLNEQIYFLKSSCHSYDSGYEFEAKRLAHTIRILVHKTKTSHALLSQLNFIDKMNFLSIADPTQYPKLIPGQSLLCFQRIGGGEASHDPFKENVPWQQWVDFQTWWHMPVIKSPNKHDFTRKDIILNLSNKQGGSHVDPKNKDEYFDIQTFENWKFSKVIEKKSVEVQFSKRPDLASIRTITFEILSSLEKHFSEHSIE